MKGRRGQPNGNRPVSWAIENGLLRQAAGNINKDTRNEAI